MIKIKSFKILPCDLWDVFTFAEGKQFWESGNVEESRNFAKRRIKSESSTARLDGELRKRKRKRNKEGKTIKLEKRRRKRIEEKVDGIWKERAGTIGTSETASLERKAVRELQIPFRPSFPLYARTLIKALRKYVYDNIQRVRLYALVMPSRMHTP